MWSFYTAWLAADELKDEVNLQKCSLIFKCIKNKQDGPSYVMNLLPGNADIRSVTRASSYGMYYLVYPHYNRGLCRDNYSRDKWLADFIFHNHPQSPVLVSWFCIPLEVKFHVFGTSKQGEGKSLANCFFAIFISTLWRFQANKKKPCSLKNILQLFYIRRSLGITYG